VTACRPTISIGQVGTMPKAVSIEEREAKNRSLAAPAAVEALDRARVVQAEAKRSPPICAAS